MKAKFKAEVMLAFTFRLPMVPLSILHLQSLDNFQQSHDPRLDVTENLLYTQAMLVWSLISATIPSLRGFVKSFNTSFGMPMAYENQGPRDMYPLVTIGQASTSDGTTRKRESRSMRSALGGFENDDEELTFQLDVARKNTISLHASTRRQTAATEEHYIMRNESQELIITKEVR